MSNQSTAEGSVQRGWGIIGTGRIAASFADAVAAEGDRVVAVSSGAYARAEAFATARGIPAAYGEHAALLSDPAVEVVYVATTNDRHHLDVGAAIEAGLAVVGEKPLAVDLPHARSLVEAARARRSFAMEGMWMRVQPGFLEAQRRVADGAIGEPLLVQADFGIAGNPDPARRWFSRALGGGALLDVGIYPVAFATAVLGPPVEVRATGVLAETGVDRQVSAGMTHVGGAVSSWSCSLAADSGVEATIAGTEGSLRIHGPFHHPSRLSLRQRDRVVEEITLPDHALGLRHEVREVQRCLDAGLTESDRIPLQATLEVLAVLDEVRSQLGVTFLLP